MHPGQRKSTMAKGTGLIISLFDITLAQEAPFGIPQYMVCGAGSSHNNYFQKKVNKQVH